MGRASGHLLPEPMSDAAGDSPISTPRKRPSRAARIGAGVLVCVATGLLLIVVGCSDVSYYWQAVGGQLEIIHKRRPIPQVPDHPAVPDKTKSRLRLAARVQHFAVTNLGLPEDGSYRYYADLGREYVSWLVVAAPALEMREHTWCYPVAGCLGYRGYFDRADAVALT